MNISPLPPSLKDLLQRKGLMAPKMCFQNSFIAVMMTMGKGKHDLSYVLGWITHEADGIRTEHAWLKEGSHYYDPTLEPQGHHQVCQYELEREFTAEDLVVRLKDKFIMSDIKAMIEGKKAWWPLCRGENGNYEFVDGPDA